MDQFKTTLDRMEITIHKDEAKKRLSRMADAKQEAADRVKRTKWRPSEKAMTIADLLEDAAALQMAITIMEAES